MKMRGNFFSSFCDIIMIYKVIMMNGGLSYDEIQWVPRTASRDWLKKIGAAKRHRDLRRHDELYRQPPRGEQPAGSFNFNLSFLPTISPISLALFFPFSLGVEIYLHLYLSSFTVKIHFHAEFISHYYIYIYFSLAFKMKFLFVFRILFVSHLYKSIVVNNPILGYNLFISYLIYLVFFHAFCLD